MSEWLDVAMLVGNRYILSERQRMALVRGLSTDEDVMLRKHKLCERIFLDAPVLNLGGHKRLKIYGRLDCPSALRYIAKGQYVNNRVFFKDEIVTRAAGYRTCAKCMPEEYKLWKEKQNNRKQDIHDR